MRLLIGRFPLHHRGILDEQALHFYTLDSMKRLLARNGWRVEARDVTSMPVPMLIPSLRKPWARPFLWILRGLTRLLPGLFAYQGILYCTNPNEGDLL